MGSLVSIADGINVTNEFTGSNGATDGTTGLSGLTATTVVN